MDLEQRAGDLAAKLAISHPLKFGRHILDLVFAVRHAALLEAVTVEPLGGDHIDAGDWFTGYAAGCEAKTAAIAALMEGTK